MKTFVVLITILLFLGCANEQEKSRLLNKEANSKYNIETFAVVWTTVSMQKDKIIKHVPDQTKQLKSLWEKGIVENVYFKADEKFNKDDTFPNIMFFLKSKNIDEAEEMLNKMVFVKNKLAIYELHPVGVLWLGRNEKSAEQVQKAKRTFGVVWITDDEKHFSDEDIKLQSKGFTNLWNEGYIENAYFDIVGASTGNKDRPTVVNFVNANNQEEAHGILKDLHFIKNGTATYILFDVGVLWLGTNNK